MKNSGKLLIGFGVVTALIIGFLIGISVDYPLVNRDSVSGTISKINNYRKAQNATSDIQLKSELISDTSRLKSVQNLLNFYYFTAVKMSGDVKFALKEATAVSAFTAANQNQMTKMTSYDKFLTSARTDLLLAISVCRKPKETNPLLLNDLLNQANNVVAQMNFKNRTVLEFVDALASYIAVNKTGKFQELKKAHDLLMINEITSAVMLNDKLVLSSFDKKALFADGKNMQMINKQEMTKLMKQDMEVLGMLDSEKLGSLINDSEKLGSFYSDSEKLGSLINDSEKLGGIVSLINDSEKLGSLINDSEKLGSLVN